MSTGTAVIIGLLALAVMILIWLAMSRSAFVKLRDSAKEAFETMEVFLEKRYELVPKLIQTVKNCTKDELPALAEAAEANRLAQEARQAGEKAANEPKLTAALETLLEVLEDYPEVQENGTFLNLCRKLQKIEDDIESSCKFYNTIVKMLNVRVRSFPSSLAAKLFRIAMQPVFRDIVGR